MQWGKYQKGALEIKVDSKTSLEESPKIFKINQEKTTKDIKELTSDGRRVNISGKIVTVNEIKEVKNGLSMRECFLEDNYGKVKIVLWEQHIEKLEEGEICRLTNMNVTQFNGENQLSFSAATEIVQAQRQLEGEIELVEPFLSCAKCNNGVHLITDILGVCTSCGSKMKISKCKQKKLQFKIRGESLKVSDQVLSLILNGGDAPLDEKLLTAPEMKFFVDGNNEVVYVTPHV